MPHIITKAATRLKEKKTEWYLKLLLGIAWLLMQLWLWNSYGVKLVPDSVVRYIPYATEFAATGTLAGGHDDRYIGYILFLALFKKLKFGLTAAVLVQVAISGLAVICFYNLIKSLTHHSTVSPFVATLLLITWKDVQYLNYYILTESLFTSSIIILFYLLTRARATSGYFLAMLAALLPTALRPNGFIALVAAVGYITALNWKHIKRYRFETGTAAGFLLTAILLILDKYLLSTFKLIETYARGEIIYASNLFAVTSPEPLVIPPAHLSPLFRLAIFVADQPAFFLELLFTKLLLFILYIKPYYSLFHNLSIILIIYPLYVFAIRYITSSRGKAPSKIFAATLFALQAAIVALTVEDWDSRFIIPMLPLVMIMGISGLRIFIKEKLLHQHSTPPPPAAP
jgi:hypothetical protein